MGFEPYKGDFRKMISQLLYRHNYFRLRTTNQDQESVGPKMDVPLAGCFQ